MFKRLLQCSVFFFAIAALTVSAGEVKKLRILGIGNSFTANSTKFLPQICAADPDVELEVGMAFIPGSPMDLHVWLATLADRGDERAKRYKFKMNGKTIQDKCTLQEIIQAEPAWDYVTIQQVSSKSYQPESFHPHAQKLQTLVQKLLPDTKVVIHETWAHSVDSPRVLKWNLPPEEMYEKLHAAYLETAQKLNIPMIPVGTAFEVAKKDPTWDYQPTGVYTSDQTELSQIPDQSKSLHNGFYWTKNKEGKSYIRADGFHANKNGEYLGGLVWYAFFFGKDPLDVSYKPDQMSEEQAASLRQAAHDTMQIQDWSKVPQ